MHLFQKLLLICLLCPLQLLAKEDPRVRVRFETSLGKFTVELYNETPKNRDNFISLVRNGYFKQTLFHRVIRDFMIQGGDPDSRNAAPGQHLGEGGPSYTIPAEICLPRYFHKRGALAAAREGDDVNPLHEGSGSQFYIVWGKTYTNEKLMEIMFNASRRNPAKPMPMTPEMMLTYEKLGGTPWLDGGYTVFGQVVKGLDVIEKIQKVATDKDDRPLTDVVVRRTYILNPKALKRLGLR